MESAVDTLGRILLPDFLVEWGALTGKVTVLGVENRVEIWDEKAWITNRAQVERQADSLAEKLGSTSV